MRHREDENESREQENKVAHDELIEVLHELHADSAMGDAREKDAPDDHVTIEAIAEAADVSEDDVRAAVARVRREDERARVARVMRELEAPTHRVERPGHASADPVANHPSLKRGIQFSDILDSLPKAGGRKRKIEKRTAEERVAAFIAYFILIFIATTAVVLLVTFFQNSVR